MSFQRKHEDEPAPLDAVREFCMVMCFPSDHVMLPEGMWRCVRWTCEEAQCHTGTDGLSQGPKQESTERVRGRQKESRRDERHREGRTVKDEKKRGEQTGEEGVITVPLNCKKHL